MRFNARPSHAIFFASLLLAGVVTAVAMSSKSSPPQAATGALLTWVIPAGANIKEVAALVAAATKIPIEDFVARANDPQFIASLGVDAPTVEGHLKPGSHRAPSSATAELIIAQLVKSQREVLEERRGLIAKTELAAQEILILASMLEKEPSDDKPALAAAWRQRLRSDMRLESHAALAFVQHDKIDRDLESPFNTFVHVGLPPYPICSPGTAAIDAVLNAPQDAPTVLLRGEAVSEEELTSLEAVPIDPPPESLARDTHYWVSNEMRHHVARPFIEHTGNVYMGVGTDQSYLFAGWIRPDMIVLMDFDQAVVHLHNIYRLVFLEAQTPERFGELWSFAGHRDLRELIKNAYPAGPKRRQMFSILNEARPKVAWRFKRMRDIYRPLGVPTFLDSREQYTHLRALFTHNRVFAIRGDLKGRKTMRTLGKVLADHGRTVGVLYLSNAEQYFGYTENFRTNIRSLPLDAHSTLFRTRPQGEDYVYILQPLENFRRWLEEPHIRHIGNVSPQKSLNAKKRPLVFIDGDPPSPPPSKRKRKPKTSGSADTVTL